MKQLVFIFMLALSTMANAQREKVQNYVNQYKDLAMAEMRRTGVPASITLAQAILESQSGESKLAQKSNNHFGIKCKTEWTGEKTYHDDDLRQECFRVYPTVEDSFKDHSDFLKNREYYTALFKLDPTDDKGWAYGLKKAGYATEKTYPTRLLKLIEDFELHQYSVQALENKDLPISNVRVDAKAPTAPANTPIVKSSAVTSMPVNNSSRLRVINQTKPPIVAEQEKMDSLVTQTAAAIENAQQEQELVKSNKENFKEPVKKNTLYPSEPFSINHTKVIFAAAGTATLSIANKYGISLSKLFDFNEMEQKDILDQDQLLFLEKKLKKGATDVYVCKAGETLTEIAQKEGVRLDALMEYNNLSKNSVLTDGQKLQLRAPEKASGKNVKSPK
ncbi:MAG: glucosaminidase domain-containing protein [Sediminibacterium sp.]